MLSMSIQQNLLRPIICVQVNLFVETMLVQVNLFVETMFVKVNPLMLISFCVNLSYWPYLSCWFISIKSTAIFYIFPFHFNIFSAQIQYNNNEYFYCAFSDSNTVVQVNLLKEIFCLFHGTVRFCFSLNTYITFQSYRTMLLLTTSEVSFFYQ